MSQTNSRVRAVFPCSAIALAMLVLSGAVQAQATPISTALRRVDGDTIVTRTQSLKDLGINAPVVLSRGQARREFYLPVPSGMPVTRASVRFGAEFLRTDESTTALVLSVDGVPTVSKRVGGDAGTFDIAVPLTGAIRRNGFVRFGVDWAAGSQGRLVCDTESPLTNVLNIAPETEFSYSYDAQVLPSLDDAWVTLPKQAVLLVSGRELDRAAFDSAWRVGAALDAAGKRTDVRALPSIGDVIDTRGVVVPAALAGIPAFATLGSATHKLANAAELGALIMLGAPGVSADVIIVDETMQKRLGEAFDALAAQFAAADATAETAFSSWRTRHASLGGMVRTPMQIDVSLLGTRPVIAVSADAGAKAAALFDNVWRHVLNTRVAVAEVAVLPDTDSAAGTRLVNLGAQAASFDVVARGDWTTNFSLGSAFAKGKMPNELVLDVAAAPGASSTRPVVSAFLNDILLGASQMRADGRPERLTVRIPGYALAVNNVVRVSFQRQPVSVDCNEVPQGFPVNVLPSSFVRAGSAEPDGTFVGLLPLMAGSPAVIIPESYLRDSAANLTRVIRMANAIGVSASGASLVVAAGEQAVKPDRAFLAMDVAVNGVRPKASFGDGGRMRIDGRETKWLDLRGTSRLGVAEVARAGDVNGLIWHGGGGPEPELGESFLLNRGDMAVIGAAGPVAWIDSANPDASQPPGAGTSAFFEWRRYVSWGVPAVALGALLFLILIIAAYRAGRKRLPPK